MYRLSAAITLAAVLMIRAFGQTASTPGAFEASVLAGLDRQVDTQKNTLAALRARYNDDYPDVETAKLNLAILQARRDALARTNAEIANRRVAVLLDPGVLTRGAGQPAAHETLFDFSKSQTITGTITQLNLVTPYSVLTVNVSGALTNVFLASANALAAAGWSRGAVKLGDQITVTGAPARGGANILQATEASSDGKPLFSRPAVELSQEAAAAYEK